MGGCQGTGTRWGGGESIKDSMREFLCGDEIVWILFGGGYMNLYEGSNCTGLHLLPPAHRRAYKNW